MCFRVYRAVMKIFKIRKNLLTFSVLGTLLVFPVTEARADSWWEFFFPSLKTKEPDPSETLQAPFAHNDDVILQTKVDEGLPDNATPLEQRHRPSVEIEKWIETVLPDLLSYDAGDFKTQYGRKIVTLDKNGQAEYYKFLEEKNFLKTLETGRYDIKAFVQEIPMILSEGEVKGRYRWLYKTKMMVTYVVKGATDYKAVREDDTITQSIFITVQVGRVPPEQIPKLPDGQKNEHGVLIESFDAKVAVDKKS